MKACRLPIAHAGVDTQAEPTKQSQPGSNDAKTAVVKTQTTRGRSGEMEPGTSWMLPPKKAKRPLYTTRPAETGGTTEMPSTSDNHLEASGKLSAADGLDDDKNIKRLRQEVEPGMSSDDLHLCMMQVEEAAEFAAQDTLKLPEAVVAGRPSSSAQVCSNNKQTASSGSSSDGRGAGRPFDIAPSAQAMAHKAAQAIDDRRKIAEQGNQSPAGEQGKPVPAAADLEQRRKRQLQYAVHYARKFWQKATALQKEVDALTGENEQLKEQYEQLSQAASDVRDVNEQLLSRCITTAGAVLRHEEQLRKREAALAMAEAAVTHQLEQLHAQQQGLQAGLRGIAAGGGDCGGLAPRRSSQDSQKTGFALVSPQQILQQQQPAFEVESGSGVSVLSNVSVSALSRALQAAVMETSPARGSVAVAPAAAASPPNPASLLGMMLQQRMVGSPPKEAPPASQRAQLPGSWPSNELLRWPNRSRSDVQPVRHGSPPGQLATPGNQLPAIPPSAWQDGSSSGGASIAFPQPPWLARCPRDDPATAAPPAAGVFAAIAALQSPPL